MGASFLASAGSLGFSRQITLYFTIKLYSKVVKNYNYDYDLTNVKMCKFKQINFFILTDRCLGMLWRVQSHQHRGVVRRGPADLIHPVRAGCRLGTLRVWGKGDHPGLVVRHLHHYEPWYDDQFYWTIFTFQMHVLRWSHLPLMVFITWWTQFLPKTYWTSATTIMLCQLPFCHLSNLNFQNITSKTAYIRK